MHNHYQQEALLLVIILFVCCFLKLYGINPLFPTCSTTQQYAGINQAGPELSADISILAAALDCPINISNKTNVILLVPGTTETPEDIYGWNWIRQLNLTNYPYCTITVPNNTMTDIQISAEYLVYSIRTMYNLSRYPIDIISHSQGGILSRFALRFWPDTRRMVDDLIGFGPSNHGTLISNAICCKEGCAPAVFQQSVASNLLCALNSFQETFDNISYTVIVTLQDEVIIPYTLCELTGNNVANIAIQDLCPNDTTEHIGLVADHTAYLLAMDAILNMGPANLQRVHNQSMNICQNVYMPGVNISAAAYNYNQTVLTDAILIQTFPRIYVEPPLKCYVTNNCSITSG